MLDDTRLWHLKAGIEDTMSTIRTFTEESMTSPADRMGMQTALQLAIKLHRSIVERMPTESLCLNYSCIGSCCYRQRDHEGPHLSEWGRTWTDQSDAAAAKQMVASMKGKTE